jgi:hypothetical protein
MNRWTQSSVTRELTVELVVTGGALATVSAVLSYDLQDPYAVTASFWSTESPPVTWIFARDLLALGADDVSGQGDVRVWASRMAGVDSVYISLSSHEGEALLRLPLAEVANFLSTTYMLCVPGEETDYLDTDRAIATLLAS